MNYLFTFTCYTSIDFHLMFMTLITFFFLVLKYQVYYKRYESTVDFLTAVEICELLLFILV